MGETVEIDRPTTGQTDLLRSAGLDLPDLQQRYRVLAELDYGGMADVFLALQVGAEGLSRLAVVKRMRAEPGAQDESTRMFLNEARLVATLSHPHIVKIFDLGWVNSDVAMAMEYVDGESLHYVYRESKRRETSIPIRVILKLMVEAAEALHYAHSATASDGSPLQLIHRDIGLQNLLLTRSGYLKVIDFGVAKTKAQTDVTTPGLIKGKIQYFAPETLTRKDIDGRADLYALGLVLYELVTLSAAHPFPRDATLAEVYERITTYVLPPVSAMRDDAPAALDGVIRRATEIDRDARFATGAEFADALRAVANGLGGLASTTEVEEWFRASFALRLQERTEFERNAVARVDDVAPLSDSGTHAYSEPRASTQRERIGSLLRTAPSAAPVSGQSGEERPRRSRWVIPLLLLLVIGIGATALSVLLSSAEPETVAATPEEYNIRVTSTPERANVFVDGALRGHTGTEGLSLRVETDADHELLVRLDGYDDYRTTVAAGAEEIVDIDAVLNAVGSADGADVVAGPRDRTSSITRRERRLRARELRRERRRAEREAEEKVEEEPAELEVLEAPEVVEPETPLPPPPPPVLEIEPEKLPPVKQAPRTLMARRVAGNQPTYPRRELERGIEDTVRVNIALDRDGKLIRYELLSGRSAFQRAVRDVVENWEFKPHVVRGQRVETRGIIEIEFKVD